MGLLVILKVQPISYENSSCDMGTFEIWSNKARKKKTKKTLLGIYVCLRGMNIQLYTTGSSRGMVNQAILLL